MKWSRVPPKCVEGVCPHKEGSPLKVMGLWALELLFPNSFIPNVLFFFFPVGIVLNHLLRACCCLYMETCIHHLLSLVHPNRC